MAAFELLIADVTAALMPCTVDGLLNTGLGSLMIKKKY